MNRWAGTRAVWGTGRWRRELERLLREHPPRARLEFDPVSIPRRARTMGAARADIEALALFTAMLAHGRADTFTAIVRSIVEPHGYSLQAAVRDTGCAWPSYRFSRSGDLRRLARAAVRLAESPGGLEGAFAVAWNRGAGLWGAVAALRARLWGLVPPAARTRGLRYLLPSADSSGCAKRWMLFLRWMVRPDDGVDLGLWGVPPPARLVVPLDRHMAFFAAAFGWTRRRTPDRRMAEEITNFLRRLDPADPLRYDFALCHLGIAGVCRHGRDRGDCRRCRFQDACGGASARLR